MLRRISLIAIPLTLVVLALVVPVLAGGWAVITLDALPVQIVSEQSYTVGFVVRQHGKTPLENLSPTIHATNADSGETLSVPAEPAGEVGHYQTTLSFPSEGTWRWSIEAFTMKQPMPDLDVLPPGKMPASLMPGEASPAVLSLVIGGLLWAALAAWLYLRGRSRRLLGLAVFGLLLAGAGLATANARAFLPETQVAPQNQPISEIETGQALFVAKGCVACHLNQRIDRRYYEFSTEVGPDLSEFSASPDFLRQWLADPAALKPETYMPDLNLSPDEIEALIAFLNAD
jgi:cytochrome c2